MSNFVSTLNPTPFGFFDTEQAFQQEADSIVLFVKRKFGDDVLSVELTKKQIWSCLEESVLEYGKIINEYQAKNQIVNLLGLPTGSNLQAEKLYPRETLNFMLRQSEAYATEAGVGGSYNTYSGSIKLESGRQDYDIYEELKDINNNLLVDSLKNNPKSKLKVFEVFHFSPQSGYRFFDTSSAINYLNNEFAFESFTPETVFYMLPTFEDVLRRGQMDFSARMRRSNYSYRISGTKIRIYPTPTSENPRSLYLRVGYTPNPFNPDFEDETIGGTNNVSNLPLDNLSYSNLNSIGRQWVRQYTVALSKEILGMVRGKYSTIPIPDGDVTLNGSDLISQGREDQTKMKDTLKEYLGEMTYSKLIEIEATKSEQLTNLLRRIPIPAGKAITIG
jgi:hypothetical protein